MSFILSYSLHLISGPSPHLCTLPKSVPSPTTSTPSISSRCPPPLTVAHPYRLLSLPLPPPTHARSPSSATSSAPSVACSPFTTYLRPKHAAEGQPTKVFRGRFQCWVRELSERGGLSGFVIIKQSGYFVPFSSGTHIHHHHHHHYCCNHHTQYQ